MDFLSTNSSGFFSSRIPLGLIRKISTKVNNLLIDRKYLSNQASSEYIVFDELNRLTYLSNIEKIINVEKLKEYLYEIICDITADYLDYKISTSELHVRWPDCDLIPPHQDNFYHCFVQPSSFKVLVPIEPIPSQNGFLNFANVSHDQEVLLHEASSVPAFSSYIPKNIISKLNIQWKSYKLDFGDISWHSINSIHFADSNCSDRIGYFLVFRFDHVKSQTNQVMQNKYQLVFKKHKKLLEEKNK